MVVFDAGAGVDAVRADGGLVHLRAPRPADRAGLRALDAAVSDQSIYNRFFVLDRRVADTYIDRLLRPADPDHDVLLALVGEVLVGVGGFERLSPAVAELGLLIADGTRRQGVGTLLMEHLAASARHRGIRRFVAEILAQNGTMIRAVRSLGFPTTARFDHEVVTLTLDLDLDGGAGTRATISDRDRRAAAASLRRLLSPRSIAVLGAGEGPGSVGHAVLTNILAGGFTGSVEVVDAEHETVLGIPSVARVADLEAPPDLAIVAVATSAVPAAVDSCGRRGARCVLVLTGGFGETGEPGARAQRELTGRARSSGMRVIGPNCLGLVNTDPGVRLNATVAPMSMPMAAGGSGLVSGLGLVSQSGALGLGLIEAAAEVGLGVAQFVSVGNKADLSGNDLLLAWEGDERVSVIALYLESFGNPRRFARIARRVARTKPVIAIKAGRSPAGQRAGRSHTAAAAAADTLVEALFADAGVLRVDTMPQLVDIARVLTCQPLPGAGRVAIVGDSGGLAVLAADAAAAAGLTVVDLGDATTGLLRAVIPAAPAVGNPVCLGSGARPRDVAAAVAILLAADEVDAVLTVFAELLPVEPETIMTAIVGAVAAAAASAGSPKPVVAVQVPGPARSVPVPGGTTSIPVFAFPEAAAAALGAAYRYRRIRSAVDADPVRPAGTDLERARTLVADRLAGGAGWLGPDDVTGLLDCYGLSLAPSRRSAAGSEVPVAVSTGTTAAVELMAGVVQDPGFGPLVMLGAGGPFADLIGDRQLRLAPLTAGGAEAMISGLRIAPLLDGDVLDGQRGRPPIARGAIRELLVRLATLADDLPEVAELDLDPVIGAGERVVVGGARARLAPAPTGGDPQARQLGAPR